MIACLGRNGSFHQLLIIPFEGGQPLKRIDLPAGDLSASRIQWTRDGHALIYLSETAILKQTLAGGLPEKIGDLIENDVFDFGYSFDGKLLAATRGEWQQDVVLINDLNRH